MAFASIVTSGVENEKPNQLHLVQIIWTKYDEMYGVFK